MIKLLKWELLKWYYRLRWILLATLGTEAVFTLLAFLGAFESVNKSTDYILMSVSLLLSVPVMLLCILLPSVNMIIDYILPYKYMEKTVQRKTAQLMLAKIIVNLALFYLGIMIEQLTSFIFTEFVPAGEEYFSVHSSAGFDIIIFIFLGIMIPIIVLFAYTLTYYIKKETKHRELIMVAVMVTGAGIVFGISKITQMSRVPEFVMMSAWIVIISSLPTMIENKYEPKSK